MVHCRNYNEIVYYEDYNYIVVMKVIAIWCTTKDFNHIMKIKITLSTMEIATIWSSTEITTIWSSMEIATIIILHYDVL